MKILLAALSICVVAASRAHTEEGVPESSAENAPPPSAARNPPVGAGRQNPQGRNLSEARRGAPVRRTETPNPAGAPKAELPALDGAEALLGRNPFGNAPASKSAKDAKSGANLQLTSICCIDGRWNFVVTDADSKISYALPLKGGITEELPYRVDFFDEETMSVSVSNSVAEYVLTLKTPDEPAAAPAAQAAPQAAKKAQQQQPTRQNYNNFRPWFPPPRVEIPTPKRINRR